MTLFRADIEDIAPGTHWKAKPATREEIIALAEFPTERLPLAADDRAEEMAMANLVLVEDLKVKEFRPVPFEIYAKSGAMRISGRILEFPEGLRNSNLVCFLDIGRPRPLSPSRYEWNEETGDFLVEFEVKRGGEGKLRIDAKINQHVKGLIVSL